LKRIVLDGNLTVRDISLNFWSGEGDLVIFFRPTIFSVGLLEENDAQGNEHGVREATSGREKQGRHSHRHGGGEAKDSRVGPTLAKRSRNRNPAVTAATTAATAAAAIAGRSSLKARGRVRSEWYRFNNVDPQEHRKYQRRSPTFTERVAFSEDRDGHHQSAYAPALMAAGQRGGGGAGLESILHPRRHAQETTRPPARPSLRGSAHVTDLEEGRGGIRGGGGGGGYGK